MTDEISITSLAQQVGVIQGSMLKKEDLEGLSTQMSKGFDRLTAAIEERTKENATKIRQLENRQITTEAAVGAIATDQKKVIEQVEKIHKDLYGNGDEGLDEILRNAVKQLDTQAKELKEFKEYVEQNKRLVKMLESFLSFMEQRGELIVFGLGTIVTGWSTSIQAFGNQATQLEVLITSGTGIGAMLLMSLFLRILKGRTKNGESINKDTHSSRSSGKNTGD